MNPIQASPFTSIAEQRFRRAMAVSVASLTLLPACCLFAQTTIVINPKNANPALRNNAPIQTVTYTINSLPVVQNASALTKVALNTPVFANSITVNSGSGNELLIFFNDIAAEVRNNNFVANTGPNLGVYNTSAPARVSIANNGLANYEAAVVNASLNNNILNYLFYDGTLQNMPNASTADFDLLYYHAFTTDDYLVVGERDGNTFFALVPLGADGNPIPGANTIQFSPNPTPGTGLGHDWNTGYINSNDSFNTQSMYFTVASIAKFFEGTSVPLQDQIVYGYRIDNNGNADVKFFGASETTFTDNPVNPLLAPGSIGDFVWFDTDLDGIQDPGENGINGVTVNLLDEAGNQVIDAQGNPLTTVTANDTLGNPGFYEFPVVFPGDYQVEFVAPPEYRLTLKDQNANDAVDSDVNPSTGRTDFFTLSADEDITTIDAGLVDASFIGNFVWIDTNGNGIQDPGEVGLNGVTVNLLDSGNNILATTTTANDGNGNPGSYLFGNLDGGTYSVEFVLPSGYAFTTQNADGQGVLGGAANSDANTSTGRTSAFSISLGSGTTNVDAGLLSADLAVDKSVTPAATVEGGTVTFTVTVTNLGPTATTGVVITDALPAGLTFVNASADQGSYNSGNGQWTVGNMALNATATLTLTATTNVGTVGQTIVNTASVTASSAPDPVSGNNSDTASVSVSALQITKTSDVVGLVNHGDTVTYTVEVENVGAGTISGVTVADLLPPGVTFVTGSVQASLDPVPAPPGTFTETINATGAGSFTVPAGVTQLRVEAWGGGGSGAASNTNNGGGGGGGGAYARLNALSVTPGGTLNYSVGGGGGLPGPGNPGNPGQASWFSTTSTLFAAGGSGGTISAGGAGGTAGSSIGNQVYAGGNGGGGATGGGAPNTRAGGGGGGSAFANAVGGNGVAGGNNSPGAGGNGQGNGGNGGRANALAAQAGSAPGGGGGGCGGAGAGTGAAGRLLITYDIPDLEGTTGNPPNLASGWTLQPGATLTVTFDVTVDNDAVITEITNVASVTSDDDPEPLFDEVTDPVNFATVGNFVWVDLNGNGIQDGGEPGLSSVTVNLLDGNGDPVLDLSGNPITTTTGTNGDYSFTGLPPGTYSVEFELPVGYTFSPQNSDSQGLNGALNSDANPATGITTTFSLSAGETNNNVDAGLYIPAGIGDFVWNDVNGNGIQNGGEPGVNGVTVNLLDSGNNVIATTTTADNGNGDPGFYLFSNLAPGTYSVEFVSPSGYIFTTQTGPITVTDNSDANTTTGRTAQVTLISGDALTYVDAGLFEPASIGDFVWNDLNGNGIQNGGEPGINGVTVNLLDSGNNVIATTTTADNGDGDPGYYLFSNLPPGTYSVEFVAPSGYVFTSQNGVITVIDNSDADTTTGRTAQVTLAQGDNVTFIDAGLYEPVSLGDFVWIDENGNGTQDSGEPGLNGVTVNLLDSGNNVIATTTTANDGSGDPGFYEFTGLAPGTYSVEFVAPSGYEFTSQTGVIDDANNSDADPSTGRTSQVTLASGDNITYIDAGLYEPVSLGDFVWIDANGNGIQDSGEIGLEGVTVSLLDGNGNPVDLDNGPISTTTGSNGEYSFTDLPPGTYAVGFGLPPGYVFTIQDADSEGVDGMVNSDADRATGTTGGVTLASGETNNNLDAGMFMQSCPDTWADWQILWNDALDGETGFSDNPDGDRYSNLIEYAFCLPPNLGVRKPFCLFDSEDTPGGVDGLFSRTAIGGAKDVTYVLEWTAALGSPTTWTSVTLDGNNTEVTNDGNGREIVRIENLQGLTLLPDAGFVRIRVNFDDGVTQATDTTDVLGWVRTEFGICCSTYCDPFLECAVFTGTVDSVNGQDLIMTTSAEAYDIGMLLEPGVAYYIEVESGDLEGHRFDVTAGGEGILTLANDSNLFAFQGPHNTLPGAASTDLAGARIALHRHRTLNSLFPPADFNATGSPTTADRVQFYISGDWHNYWLFDDNGSARWVSTADNDFNDMGGIVIPPGRGMFHDNRSASATPILAFGEVREHDFANPLPTGVSLIAGGYPIDQAPRGSGSRVMELAATAGEGFFGSRNFATADTVFRWRTDIDSALPNGYETYFLLSNASPAVDKWVLQIDATRAPQDSAVFFERDRSVLKRVRDGFAGYRIPAPWTPDP